jgi:DNA repair protein RecO (recombination protein O)
LSVCSIVLLRKTPGGLDLLTEARVNERFPALRSDLPALYAGYYVAELLDVGTEERDPHPALYDAAVETLRSLGHPEGRDGQLTAAFEMAWLRELGYAPKLEACVGCGRSGVGERLAFSATAGGTLCPRCAASHRDRRPLTEAARQRLLALQPGPGAVGELWETTLRQEVRQLLNQYVCHVLGRRPRLMGYLR